MSTQIRTEILLVHGDQKDSRVWEIKETILQLNQDMDKELFVTVHFAESRIISKIDSQIFDIVVFLNNNRIIRSCFRRISGAYFDQNQVFCVINECDDADSWNDFVGATLCCTSFANDISKFEELIRERKKFQYSNLLIRKSRGKVDENQKRRETQI